MKTDWKEIYMKSGEASRKDDLSEFWKIQIDATMDITNRIAREVEGYPNICAPMVLAALDAVRESVTSGHPEKVREVEETAAEFIRKRIVSTKVTIPAGKVWRDGK